MVASVEGSRQFAEISGPATVQMFPAEPFRAVTCIPRCGSARQRFNLCDFSKFMPSNKGHRIMLAKSMEQWH
ncbi:unnamed protein product, partial [Mesorhabditis spiculigera]